MEELYRFREALRENLDPFIKDYIVGMYSNLRNDYEEEIEDELEYNDNPEEIERLKKALKDVDNIEGYIYIIGKDSDYNINHNYKYNLHQITYNTEVFLLDPKTSNTTKLSKVEFYIEGYKNENGEWDGGYELSIDQKPKNSLVSNFLKIIEDADPTGEYNQGWGHPDFDSWEIGMFIHKGINVENYESYDLYYPQDLYDLKSRLKKRSKK